MIKRNLRKQNTTILMKKSNISRDEVTSHWNDNADIWTEHVRKGWDLYRELFNNPNFFRFIGDLKGKRVLDAGCGEGYNTRILAKGGAMMSGVDISNKMIEFAKIEEKKEKLGIQYEIASFTDLSLFEECTFDAVVSFMAIMDSPDLESIFKEIFRVLKKDGRFIFSVTHPCFLTKGLEWIEDENENAIKLTVSDYFNNQPWIEEWKFSHSPEYDDVKPFSVPSYPWTLSEYINTLIKNRFILKKIEESRPSQDVCDKHPCLQRWRDHAAIFFYVYAIKP